MSDIMGVGTRIQERGELPVIKMHYVKVSNCHNETCHFFFTFSISIK